MRPSDLASAIPIEVDVRKDGWNWFRVSLVVGGIPAGSRRIWGRNRAFDAASRMLDETLEVLGGQR